MNYTTMSKTAIEYLCKCINLTASIPELLNDVLPSQQNVYSSYRVTELLNTLQGDMQNYVNAAIGNLSHLKKEIVSVAPTSDTAKEDTIYLVQDVNGGYEQYLLINGAVTSLGSTSAIANVYTKSESDSKFALQNTFKSLVDAVGGLNYLSTTDKTSIVNAINELKSGLDDLLGDNAGDSLVKTSGGINLFNKDTATSGYYVGSSNNLVSNGSSSYSDFIEVKHGEIYSFTGHYNNVYQFATYDADKNFIEIIYTAYLKGSYGDYKTKIGYKWQDTDWVDRKKSTVKYIKVNVSNVNKYMLVKGETMPSEYVGYENGDYTLKSTLLETTINNMIKESIPTEEKKPIVISCWGDSKTEGNQDGTGITYPSHLQTLLTNAGINAIVNNFGCGGEYSSEIAQRQGGLPLIVQPFTIPATATKVNISLNGRLRIASKHKFNPCYINNIEGTIIHDWSDNNQRTFTFQRTEAGDSVEIKYPMQVKNQCMIENKNDDVLIIDIGCNGGYSSIENWIQQIRCMIDYSVSKEFIVIGLANHLAYSFGSTSENYETLEAKFAKEFGNRYINLRKFYVEYGLEVAGLTPTTQDETDISNGIPPQSLYKSGDNYHENQYGYKIKAQLVFEKLRDLNLI